MSKLNKDILALIFEELQKDSKSLFSCLMVNRLWCETVIPILWRNPWCYAGVDYSNKNYLFFIISCYLFNDIKEFITEQRIQLPSSSNQSLLFDYLSFCRSIDINTINSIISIGSSLPYNQFSMQQEFFYCFMKKCPELKYFDMRSIKHQIFYFPNAKARLESLRELRCETSIDPSYFYGLSLFCQHIQGLIIVNTEPKSNHGIVKLIEVQKNLNHFEWKDDFYSDYLTEDPYKDIFLALEKKAVSLNYLKIFFQYAEGIENTILQKILPKLYKLKILIFDDYLFFIKEELEKLRMQVYHDLEIINIEWNSLNVLSSIIENSGKHLKKILFRPYDTLECDYHNFNENSLNFIRKIYENCPLIEYLSIAFSPLKEHFVEFEKLLKICQNLKSLLIIIHNVDKIETNKEILENGEILLKILISSAPISLKEIRFYDDFKFSLENLEEFLVKWRGRPALSILTIDPIYIIPSYTEMITKYKRDGVIKDFKHSFHVDEIDYHF
ncbi:hypothetical protein RclHR1_00680035 [Rhizophagus clarus]|uniref:F-box domain-containing protein n=1 Tax=Rhizophagus clarus TaxID=94130 RepID=A0A2Z6RVS6_9GLOM|nr:hypothetical protein RclHR1_00680035 [Rhizophagus clarus]GET04810.1 hypothetical protein GLOIN_2v1764020 [Rhizophagus clarus]